MKTIMELAEDIQDKLNLLIEQIKMNPMDLLGKDDDHDCHLSPDDGCDHPSHPQVDDDPNEER